MRARLSEEQRRELEAFIEGVDADPEGTPPPLRSRREASRHLASLLLRANAGDADAAEIAEIEELLSAATLWEKGLLQLPPGLVWELTKANLDDWRAAGKPGQIWIRWDAVPPEMRDVVLSQATALRDAYLGRPRGGRPRGSRLTSKEKTAIAAVDEPLDEIGPVRGWRHMVAHGAWEHDQRADNDPKAQQARAARWRRLHLRALSEIDDG